MVKLLLVALACWLPLMAAIDLHSVPSILTELDSKSKSEMASDAPAAKAKADDGSAKKDAKPAAKEAKASDAKKDAKPAAKEGGAAEKPKEEKGEDSADAAKGAAGDRLAKIEKSLKKLTSAVGPKKKAAGAATDMSNWEPAKVIKKAPPGGDDTKLLKEIKKLTKDQPESALGKPPKMPAGDVSWMANMEDVLEYPCKGGNKDNCEKKAEAAAAKAAKGKGGAKGDPKVDAEKYNKIKEILGLGGKGGEAKGKGDDAKGKGDEAKGKGEEGKGDEAKGDEAKGDEAKGKGDEAEGKGDEGKGDEAKGKGDDAKGGEGKAAEGKADPKMEKIKAIVKGGDSLLDNDDGDDEDDFEV